MKIKGVELKNITLRPLPLKALRINPIKPIKHGNSYMKKSSAVKSTKGIRFKEKDFFLTLFLSGFVLGVLYISVPYSTVHLLMFRTTTCLHPTTR